MPLGAGTRPVRVPGPPTPPRARLRAGRRPSIGPRPAPSPVPSPVRPAGRRAAPVRGHRGPRQGRRRAGPDLARVGTEQASRLRPELFQRQPCHGLGFVERAGGRLRRKGREQRFARRLPADPAPGADEHQLAQSPGAGPGPRADTPVSPVTANRPRSWTLMANGLPSCWARVAATLTIVSRWSPQARVRNRLPKCLARLAGRRLARPQCPDFGQSRLVSPAVCVHPSCAIRARSIGKQGYKRVYCGP